MKNEIHTILETSRTIAIVGASKNENKDSYKVMKYLQHKGYKIFPINHNFSDRKILGETVYDKIEDIQNDIDIVNVFRPSDEVIAIAKQAIEKKVKTLWLQLDIISPESKLIVESEGINFIENKCTKIEHEKFLR
jgi:hypothetical protein